MTGHWEDQVERETIADAQAGDIEAFNRLVDQYQRLVYAVCLRLLRDPQLAEDVTQETFVRAYTSMAQFQGGSFRAWLLRIATNRSYDLIRHDQRRPAQSLEAQPVEAEPRWSTEPPSEDPVQQATRQELSQRLEQALGQLPEDQRVVVLLYDVHGYSYDEIAESTGVSLGTVKSRLSRARARLREILRADEQSRELFDSVSRHLYDDPAAGRETSRGWKPE